MRTEITARRPGLKVGYHHFALFRGTLDSIPLETLGDRYLETGTDLRHAKRTLAWVRKELMAAASRYRQETGITAESLIRLIRVLQSSNLKPEDRIALAEIPTLEDFQADFDPSGFYSESELITEFEKRYGGGEGPSAAALRKVEQNDRLRRKLRQAIEALESRIAVTPKPDDSILIWFEPIVALPLRSAGVLTIEDLVGLINRRGNLWHKGIAKFGAVRAKRVVRWLQINKVMPIKDSALVPFRQIAAVAPSLRKSVTAIVPMEHLVLPVDLDGTMGWNRARGEQCAARNDLEAIGTWINAKAKKSEHTRKAYTAQAERFVLWLAFEKGRAMSGASVEDCSEYLNFLYALGDPKKPWVWLTTRDQWVAPKVVPRWNDAWRPFTGDMSPRSRKMAYEVLKSMFTWLVGNGYLKFNPWKSISDVTSESAHKIEINHVLNERQWIAVCDELEESRSFQESPAEDERYCRMRFMFWLGYACGLRQDEMIKLTAASLERSNDDHWQLSVLGKGRKKREIPLPASIYSFLLDYMEARGHSRNPGVWDKTLPLLTALKNQNAQKHMDQPLSPRTVTQILKTHFDVAAERLDDLYDQDGLRQASTHWLRHTAATNMVGKGVHTAVVQDLLGHSDPKITALYTHADMKQKRAAIDAVLGAG